MTRWGLVLAVGMIAGLGQGASAKCVHGIDQLTVTEVTGSLVRTQDHNGSLHVVIRPNGCEGTAWAGADDLVLFNNGTEAEVFRNTETARCTPGADVWAAGLWDFVDAERRDFFVFEVRCDTPVAVAPDPDLNWREVVGVASNDVLWIRDCGSAKCQKVGFLRPGERGFYTGACEGRWCQVFDAAGQYQGWSHSRYLRSVAGP